MSFTCWTCGLGCYLHRLLNIKHAALRARILFHACPQTAQIISLNIKWLVFIPEGEKVSYEVGTWEQNTIGNSVFKRLEYGALRNKPNVPSSPLLPQKQWTRQFCCSQIRTMTGLDLVTGRHTQVISSHTHTHTQVTAFPNKPHNFNICLLIRACTS